MVHYNDADGYDNMIAVAYWDDIADSSLAGCSLPAMPLWRGHACQYDRIEGRVLIAGE
jgi:hypothetical protein